MSLLKGSTENEEIIRCMNSCHEQLDLDLNDVATGMVILTRKLNNFKQIPFDFQNLLARLSVSITIEQKLRFRELV